jgi:Ras-related protein Rab-2A
MSVGNYNYLFKFILVGDTCNLLFESDVGKSNMLIQYTQKKFRGEHQITIGCEFMAKNINIKNKNIRIQIWDTVNAI